MASAAFERRKGGGGTEGDSSSSAKGTSKSPTFVGATTCSIWGGGKGKFSGETTT